MFAHTLPAVSMAGRTGNTWTELGKQPAQQSPDTADYPGVTISIPANARLVDMLRVSFAALDDNQRLVIPEIELWARED